jgi:hypothetical protein
MILHGLFECQREIQRLPVLLIVDELCWKMQNNKLTADLHIITRAISLAILYMFQTQLYLTELNL